MIYTIGYEERTLEEFIEQLKLFNISTLVDIRENPFSRKKGFSKNALAQSLEENGIEYIHLKELGSPKPLRDKLRQDGDEGYFFKEYYKYVQSQKPTVQKLHQLVSERIVCLMCYERLPEHCHRHVVAEEIKRVDGNGLNLHHI